MIRKLPDIRTFIRRSGTVGVGACFYICHWAYHMKQRSILTSSLLSFVSLYHLSLDRWIVCWMLWHADNAPHTQEFWFNVISLNLSTLATRRCRLNRLPNHQPLLYIYRSSYAITLPEHLRHGSHPSTFRSWEVGF